MSQCDDEVLIDLILNCDVGVCDLVCCLSLTVAGSQYNIVQRLDGAANGPASQVLQSISIVVVDVDSSRLGRRSVVSIQTELRIAELTVAVQ